MNKLQVPGATPKDDPMMRIRAGCTCTRFVRELSFGTVRSVSIAEAAYVGTISDADYRASFTMVREAGSNEEEEEILAG